MPEMLWLPNPDDGARIAAGFDGSENNDWSAIQCETIDGFSFTPRYGPDRRPAIWNPAEWGGFIPRGEVHAAVDEIFTRYKVSRFYADPHDWYSEIGDWSMKYGEEHVFEWPTNQVSRMYPEIRRFEIDLAQGGSGMTGALLRRFTLLTPRRSLSRDRSTSLVNLLTTKRLMP